MNSNNEDPENDEVTCMSCKNKECSLINDLNFDELRTLNKTRKTKKYKLGSYIYTEGDKPSYLIYLSEGKVKITKQGNWGNELIVELKKSGGFLGFSALIQEGNYLTNAIALEDVEVCIINKSDFLPILKTNSELSNRIMRHFANELDTCQSRIIHLTQKHLRGRMAEALLLVEQVYGISNHDDSLDIELKRMDYAALANMNTANAIRILSSFAKEGLIHLQQRNIKLLKKEELQNISRKG